MVLKLSFIFLFFSHFVYSTNDFVNSIELKIGEIKILSELKDAKINLSRRGIILASFNSKNQWQIVGHRKGFVVLSYFDSQKNEAKKILITVTNLENKKVASKSLPWFCYQNEINCQEKPLRFSGLIDSWQLFYQIKHWSREHKSSFNSLELSSRAQKSLNQKLKTVISNPATYQINSYGLQSVQIPCDIKDNKRIQIKKHLQFVLNPLYITTMPEVICHHTLNPKSFEVSAKIFLLSQDSESLQGGRTIQLSELLSSPYRKNLLSHLESLERNNSLEIVGEPRMMVKEGVESISQTGGEFSYIKEANLSQNTYQSLAWKSYGLQLKATVLGEEKQKVLISYNLSLSSPSSATAASSVKKNLFTGQRLLILNKEDIVAVTRYERQEKKNEQDSFWSKIPLVSIFFTKKTQEKISSYLVFSVKVSRI